MAPGKRHGLKQDNRGGARKGAGRKSHDLAPEFKDELKASLEKHEKETGDSFTDMIVQMAMDKRTPILARMGLIKTIASTFVVKQSHQTIDKREMHAVVMLPPVMSPPQMLVEGAGPVIDGGTGEVVGS